VHMGSMKWFKEANGLGPAERNMSNGGAEAGDGSTMSIAGQGYFRGLGVAANSQLRFNLDSKFRTFTTDVGVDDTSKGRGSVVFEVWTDGQKAFDSGAVTFGAKARTISVPVQGKKELWLVVTDAGRRSVNVLANWANARLAA